MVRENPVGTAQDNLLCKLLSTSFVDVVLPFAFCISFSEL